jgi:hypothetical protein
MRCACNGSDDINQGVEEPNVSGVLEEIPPTKN